METTELVLKVARLAVADFHNHIPERHRTNAGTALYQRCGIRRGFKGDSKYLRGVYTAAYWWESMKEKRDEPPQS